MANVKPKPNYKTIEGLLLPGMFKPENIRAIMNYKPKPEDVFIVTYPKCGTTWMQNIVYFIFRKGEEQKDFSDMHTSCPFLDPIGLKGIENLIRPGTLKTHLPYTHTPFSPEAKYIYVLRNPKDCCVSLYYHTKRIPPHNYADATFDDFFEIFMTGEVEYGDYFDHLMSWYPHLKDKNVFFTTYEDMKKDTKGVIIKLASFLGQEYKEAIEKDNNVLNNILRFTSFDYMKANRIERFMHPKKPKQEQDSHMMEDKKEVNHPKIAEDSHMMEDKKEVNHSKIAEDSHMMKDKKEVNNPKIAKEQDLHMMEDKKEANNSKITEKPDFLRKGIVGDWKNHFSEEQNARMKDKFIDRTRGTEIYDTYKNYTFY